MLIRFKVSFETKVLFASSKEEVEAFFSSILQEGFHKIALVVDETVHTLFQEMIAGLLPSSLYLLIVVPSGEKAKSRSIKENIENQMLEEGFGRDSCLIAIGGGATLDLGGFVAATYARGIPFFSVPTTFLAMVDACLGRKTGLNALHIKNCIGSVYPAKRILISLGWLSHLPKREYNSAIAEMIKYSLIADRSLFFLLKEHHLRWKEKDPSFLLELIRQGLLIKKGIFEQDPFETGLRRILNFGHTIGHALESLFSFTYLHGEAVAIGLYIESFLSTRFARLSGEELHLIQELLMLYECPLLPKDPIILSRLQSFLEKDKKASKQTPRFVLLDSIGAACESEGQFCQEVSTAALEEAFAQATKGP